MVWYVTKDGGITVTEASSNAKIYYGRASCDFTSEDTFAIPEQNSSINFAFDGTYVFSNLNNNVWRFQNLIKNDHSFTNSPKWYFSISARDCNVVITNHYPPKVSNGVEGIINYTVTGIGTQSIDNNYDSLGSFDEMNYTVYVDGVKRDENEGWTVTDDGWLTISGATSNVTILYHQIIPEWIRDAPEPGGGLIDDHDEDVITRASNVILIMLVIVTIIGIILFISRKSKKIRNKGE